MNTVKPHLNYFNILDDLTAAGQPFEIASLDLDGCSFKAYKNAPRTLIELVNAGRVHAEKEFLLYEGELYSFQRFFAEADAVACQLAERGVASGDRVAIAMRNYPEWMMAFTAIALLGAVPVTVNSWGTAEEILYILDEVKAEHVFLDWARYQMLNSGLTERQISAVVVRPEADCDACNWQELVAAGSGQQPPEPELSPDQVALIIYTSGTTGRPKGVFSSHRQVCQAIYNFECCGMAMAMTNGDLLGKLYADGGDFSALLAVPLFHVSGCFAVFLLNLRSGRRTVMMYKWDVDKALEYIETEKIGVLSVAPAMLMALFEHPDLSSTDTSKLYFIGAGGSAIPSRLPAIIEKEIPQRLPGCGYGSTETNASACSMNGHLFRERPQAAGLPSPLMEIQIRDQAGQQVLPENESGEIWVYGIAVASGYWNQPEVTAECFQKGWFRTGDIGFIDSDQYLHVVDRVKDIVIRAGENISSNEVENVLGSHEAVLESGVFGLPHEQLGEEVAARVVLRPGKKLSSEQLQQFAAERLAHFKVPEHLFFTEEPLPRNPTGKILKNVLRKQHQN